MGAFGRFRAYARFLAGLPAFLRTPLTLSEARERIARRHADRTERFLSLLERAVFARQSSPYLPMFREARCELGDVRTELARHGLEKTLAELARAGVRASFDEFKGRADGRDGRPPLEAADFDNPFLRGGFQLSTGGSSGHGVRTQHDLDLLDERSVYEAVALEMTGLAGKPLALCYPRLPASTGFNNTLRNARVGQAAERWFQLLDDAQTRPGPENRLAMRALLWTARLAGRPLAAPRPFRLDDVVQWILDARDRAGACALQSYVSQALRVARRARELGEGLWGVTFVVGSEPLTKARDAELRSGGASVYSRYMATEVGSLAMGCATPAEIDDHHLLTDTVTAVQPDGPDALLLFTSLLFEGPKILINVELGDTAVVERRRCGCAFGELGFETHLSRIRGVAVVSVAGMTVSVGELTRVTDERLVASLGCSPLDLQWVERESADGEGGLRLRIHPRLGPLDERAAVDLALEALGSTECGRRLIAAMWRETGALSIERAAPERTAAGKQLPLVRESKRSRS